MKIKTTKQIIFETEEEIKLIEVCLNYCEHRVSGHNKKVGINQNLLEEIITEIKKDK